MGIFHYRCAATDLPLIHGRSVFVATRETSPGVWSPVILPVVGMVSGYGRLEGLSADFRSTVLANAIEDATRSNRVVAMNEAKFELEQLRPLTPEGALHVIERATTMSPWASEPGLLVDGHRVESVCFKKEIYDAITKEAGALSKREPTPDEVRTALSIFDDPFGAWVHRDLHKVLPDTRRKVVGAVNELRALQWWMSSHQRPWLNPPTGQFGEGDTLEALLRARRKFADDQTMIAALNREGTALERTVAENESLQVTPPPRWTKDADVNCYALHFGEKRLLISSVAELRELIIREAATMPADDAVIEVMVVEQGLINARHPLRPLINRGSELAPALDAFEQALAPLQGAPTRKSAAVIAEPTPWGSGFLLQTYARDHSAVASHSPSPRK